MSSALCIHIDGVSELARHRLPYRAHIRLLEDTDDDIVEAMESVHLEFDHQGISALADQRLHQLSHQEETELCKRVGAEALAIYMHLRLRGEPFYAVGINSCVRGGYTEKLEGSREVRDALPGVRM